MTTAAARRRAIRSVVAERLAVPLAVDVAERGGLLLDERRDSGSAEIWGRVEAADGRAVEGRVRSPEGYKTTVIAALASVRRMLEAPPAPGYHTPATAFGSGFIASLPGCSLQVPDQAGA